MSPASIGVLTAAPASLSTRNIHINYVEMACLHDSLFIDYLPVVRDTSAAFTVDLLGQ